VLRIDSPKLEKTHAHRKDGKRLLFQCSPRRHGQVLDLRRLLAQRATLHHTGIELRGATQPNYGQAVLRQEACIDFDAPVRPEAVTGHAGPARGVLPEMGARMIGRTAPSSGSRRWSGCGCWSCLCTGQRFWPSRCGYLFGPCEAYTRRSLLALTELAGVNYCLSGPTRTRPRSG